MGQTYDGETDESVNDGVFGFFEFLRVTRRSDVSDTAHDGKYGGGNARDADYPVNEVCNNLFGFDGTTTWISN